MRAHKRDSIEPNKASVVAGMSKNLAVSQLKSGHAKAGKLLGMLPKREAMVSTSSPIIFVATVAPISTTIEPGMVEKLLVLGMVCPKRGNASCQNANTAKHTTAKPTASPL